MKQAAKYLGAAALAGLLAAGGLYLLGGDEDLTVVPYPVSTDKLAAPLCLALVTDLHSCDYGEGQADLLTALEAMAPDAILLGGDILDDDLPRAKGDEFVTLVAQRWPTYYVSGNHEYRTGEMDQIKSFLRSLGITVLEGESVSLTLRGQTLTLCGLDDPEGIGDAAFAAQLERVGQAADPETFTILLSHRPEPIHEYLQHPFDLILSGHAHGGQWRIPGVLNGLLAPNQGLFPDYAGGRYDFPHATFLVSRGLARESTRLVPRLFNPPELVRIDLLPLENHET